MSDSEDSGIEALIKNDRPSQVQTKIIQQEKQPNAPIGISSNLINPTINREQVIHTDKQDDPNNNNDPNSNSCNQNTNNKIDFNEAKPQNQTDSDSEMEKLITQPKSKSLAVPQLITNSGSDKNQVLNQNQATTLANSDKSVENNPNINLNNQQNQQIQHHENEKQATNEEKQEKDENAIHNFQKQQADQNNEREHETYDFEVKKLASKPETSSQPQQIEKQLQENSDSELEKLISKPIMVEKLEENKVEKQQKQEQKENSDSKIDKSVTKSVLNEIQDGKKAENVEKKEEETNNKDNNKDKNDNNKDYNKKNNNNDIEVKKEAKEESDSEIDKLITKPVSHEIQVGKKAEEVKKEENNKEQDMDVIDLVIEETKETKKESNQKPEKNDMKLYVSESEISLSISGFGTESKAGKSAFKKPQAKAETKINQKQQQEKELKNEHGDQYDIKIGENKQHQEKKAKAKKEVTQSLSTIIEYNQAIAEHNSGPIDIQDILNQDKLEKQQKLQEQQMKQHQSTPPKNPKFTLQSCASTHEDRARSSSEPKAPAPRFRVAMENGVVTKVDAPKAVESEPEMAEVNIIINEDKADGTIEISFVGDENNAEPSEQNNVHERPDLKISNFVPKLNDEEQELARLQADFLKLRVNEAFFKQVQELKKELQVYYTSEIRRQVDSLQIQNLVQSIQHQGQIKHQNKLISECDEQQFQAVANKIQQQIQKQQNKSEKQKKLDNQFEKLLVKTQAVWGENAAGVMEQVERLV